MKLSQKPEGENEILNTNGTKEREVPSMANRTINSSTGLLNMRGTNGVESHACSCSILSFNLAKQLLLPVES